jgi:hypothetical protein
MKSRTTKRFWTLYYALPSEIQTRADKAYELWLDSPQHPSLQFKRVDRNDPIYAVRISLQYRALGILRGDTITWYWIGKHEIYDRLLS